MAFRSCGRLHDPHAPGGIVCGYGRADRAFVRRRAFGSVCPEPDPGQNEKKSKKLEMLIKNFNYINCTNEEKYGTI